MQLKKLRDVRRDRELSQRELGERIGVNQSRISSIEWGTKVGRDTALRLAKALLCDVSGPFRTHGPDHNGEGD